MKHIYAYLILACCAPFSLVVIGIAQTTGEAVDYYGNTVSYEVQEELGFSSNANAIKVINNIMSFTGLEQNFEIRAESDVYIALATVINKKRTILYDPAFMRQALASSGDTNWVTTNILAHEIAHHLNNHHLQLEATSSIDRKKLELEADKFAGFILYEMGAELEQAQLALQSLPDVEVPNSLHPAKADRFSAVAKGWYDAQAKALNDSRKVAYTDTNTFNSKEGIITVSNVKQSSTRFDLKETLERIDGVEGVLENTYNADKQEIYIEAELSKDLCTVIDNLVQERVVVLYSESCRDGTAKLQVIRE